MNVDYKTRDWFAELDEEITEFGLHPIKASDIIYTRDDSHFHYLWDNFIKQTGTLFIDYLHLAVEYDDRDFHKSAREILNFVENTIFSIRGWEQATGNCLIHSISSVDGSLRLHLSVLNLLRTVNQDYSRRTRPVKF